MRSDAEAEPIDVLLDRVVAAGGDRVRVVGVEPTDQEWAAAAVAHVHLAAVPVTPAGRVELLHYVREQSLSITRHRFGNLRSDL